MHSIQSLVNMVATDAAEAIAESKREPDHDHAAVLGEQLRHTAERLNRWANEASYPGAASTQHVEPMRVEAARIYALLGRLSR